MLHRFAVLTACLTFPLIFAGATVTTKDAALAVPDWPLSYGSLFPRMVGNIVYEHGHRMIAALVGLFTMILAIWLHRAEPRRWVRVLGWCALGAVLAQGGLGGLTVLQLRPPAVSAAHGCLAQAFFATVASIAIVTSPGWVARETLPRAPSPRAPGLRALAIAAVVVVYLQVILGAVVRHTGAALSIPDFPLAFGGLWPPAEKLADPGVAFQLAHRLWAVAVLAATAAAAVRSLRSGARELRSPAVALLVLVVFQALLGAATVWSGRAYVPATAHVAFGAMVLVTAVVLAIRIYRFVPAGAAVAGSRGTRDGASARENAQTPFLKRPGQATA